MRRGEVLGVARPGPVGREGELAALHDQIRAAAAGQGRLVLVDGEPGIGKTLLVRTALAQAPGVILAGAGAELDQRLPFSTIRSCLEARAADDGQIGSVLALMARGDTEYAVVEPGRPLTGRPPR